MFAVFHVFRVNSIEIELLEGAKSQNFEKLSESMTQKK